MSHARALFPLRLIAISSLAAFSVTTSAQATPTSPQKTFNRLNACIQNGDMNECRDDVTASSAALYDRAASYGLAECLPKDAAVISQLSEGDTEILRVRTKSLGPKERTMRLRFVEEEGRWKLDITESLRAGLGDNWEQQVTMAEQAYLALKDQMGGNLSCGAVQALMKK